MTADPRLDLTKEIAAQSDSELRLRSQWLWEHFDDPGLSDEESDRRVEEMEQVDAELRRRGVLD